MFTRKLVAISALLATTAMPVFASAAESGATQCALREYKVTTVTPYQVDHQIGRTTVKQLQGAQVFVQAEPGLTAEWLRLQLGRHLAEMRGPTMMRDCAFGIDDVRVEVDSAGPGFWVKLIANDTVKAAEVLRRARLLLG